MSRAPTRSGALRRLGGCAVVPLAAAWPRASGAQQLATLRVGVAEGDDTTPTLYAQKVGLFAKYGLAVQITLAPSGAAGLAALAGGAVDYSGTSLLSFISARSRGVPLQIVAPLAYYNPEAPYAALLVAADSPYHTGRDLTGKTIASPALRDLNWIATAAWIDQNGGDSSSCKTVELIPSAIPAALVEGRVDCATVTTPRYVQAVKSGKIRSLGYSYESIAKRFTFAAYVSTEQFAAKNPDVVQRFGRAIREATRYTNTHHAETLALYTAFVKIDPKTVSGAPRAFNAEYVEARDLQPMIDVAVKYKVIDHALDPREMINPAVLRPGA